MSLVDIIWGDVINCSHSAGVITKNSGSGDTYNASGLSTQEISSNGHFEFVKPDTTHSLYTGLGTNSNTSALHIPHAFAFAGGGSPIVEIRENGAYKGEFSFTAGDTFKLTLVSGTVKYYLNDVLKYTSANTHAFPAKADISIQTVGGTITSAKLETGSSGGGGETPTNPTNYDPCISDRVIREEGTPPTITKGQKIVDPNFGCYVTRITDGNTGVSLGLSADKSWHTPDAPNQSGVNYNSTKFWVKNDNASVLVFDFDPETGTASEDRRLSFSIEPAFPRANVPGIIYGVRFTQAHRVETYHWANSTYTTLLDITTIDPGVTANDYTNQLYCSAGVQPKIAVLYGSYNADLHHKVVVFEIANTANYRIINTQLNTVNGVAALRTDGVTSANISHNLHSIAISHDGDVVRLDPTGTSQYFWLYYWSTNRFHRVENESWGHYAMGWTNMVNENTNQKMNWWVRSLATPNTGLSMRITTHMTGGGDSGDHTCWNNANAPENTLVPFTSECQRGVTAANNFWLNEIIAVQATGTEKVWRFCHHRMDGRGDTNPLSQPFRYQPCHQVMPQGTWVLFKSNWQKTLGTTAGWSDPNDINRIDVFAVQLALANAVSPEVAITAPANNASVNRNSVVTINATATYASGPVANVRFYSNNVFVASDSSSPYSVTWNANTPGVFVLTAVVTASDGSSAQSAPITLNVNNVLPTVSITAPANAASFNRNSLVTIDATAGYTVGAVANVKFYANGVLIGSDSAAPFTTNWSANTPGTFLLTAVVTTDDLQQVTSAPITVIINNVLPTVSITAPANNATYPANTVVTINATAAYSAGLVSSVGFYSNNVLIGTDTGSPYTIDWNALLPGTWPITAVVTTDDGQQVQSDPITVTITGGVGIVTPSGGRVKVFRRAKLGALQDAGQIVKVKILNSGVNYIDANAVSIDAIHGGERTGLDAAFTPVLGALTRYPGRYTTSQGWLSADKFLQDDKFYNNFTYVVRTAESFDRYKEMLLKLLHPAGFQALGEFVETQTANVAPTANSDITISS